MNDIQKTIQGARAAQVRRIYSGLSNAQEVTSDESKLTKGDESKQIDSEENPFEKAVADFELMEKSDILDAIDSNNCIKLSKTGKEIKDQISNVILPKLNSELAEAKSSADKILETCGTAPNVVPDVWWTGGIKIDCGYKIYNWEQTYYSEDKPSISYSTFDAIEKRADANEAENKEIADSRRKYNECVRKICNIVTDLKACEILNQSADTKEYELTPRQIIALNF